MVRSEGSTSNVELLKGHGANLICLGWVSVEHLSKAHTVTTKNYVVATVLRISHREESPEINLNYLLSNYLIHNILRTSIRWSVCCPCIHHKRAVRC